MRAGGVRVRVRMPVRARARERAGARCAGPTSSLSFWRMSQQLRLRVVLRETTHTVSKTTTNYVLFPRLGVCYIRAYIHT